MWVQRLSCAIQRLYHQICHEGKHGLKAVETKSDEAELVHLDKRMMSTPSVAVEGAKLETIRMGRIARENLSLALSTLSDHDEEKMADVKQREFVIVSFVIIFPSI